MTFSLVDISRISLTTPAQIEGYAEAERIWTEGWGHETDPTRCPNIIQRGHERYVGKQCRQKAGQGTNHLGYGQCVAHGGARHRGKIVGAWLMAHKFAEELDVSPWEALLLVIRITAGRLRYIEGVLGTANSDLELEGRAPDGSPLGVSEGGELVQSRNLSWWVEKSEQERDRLAKVSKAAIDAGVAQLLIEKELRAGEEKAQEYVKLLEQMESAGMPDEMLEIARGVLRQELQLALDS